MKLTILGSGTNRINLKRSSPAYLLEAKGKKILLDAGPDCIKQLLRANKHILDIDAILFSHFHSDHYLELPLILTCLRHQGRYPSLGICSSKKVKRLKIYGPSRVKQIVKKWQRDVSVDVKVIGRSDFKLFGLQIKTLPVIYKGQVLGFRFQEGKKVFTYSSDSTYCKNLLTLAKNTDTLLQSVGLPDKFNIILHPSFSDVGKIASEANVKKIILTHFYPVVEKYNYKKDIKKYYKGPIVVAKDLMKINV